MQFVIGRREMLGSCAAGAAGLAGLAQASLERDAGDHGGAGATARHVLVETRSPESRMFAASLHGAVLVPVEPTMSELIGTLAAPLAGVVLGLTSDPVEMIARQLLVERGGRPISRRVHGFSQGTWWHEMGSWSAALAGSGARWPAALARLFNQPGDDVDIASERCNSGPCRLHSLSPGLLVSWAIDMREAAR